MTSGDHQEAKELFGKVVDLEPHCRASILDEACVGRPQLRQEVESLRDRLCRAVGHTSRPHGR